MKMKKLTAMGMAALMAATMIPAVPVMAEGEGKVYYLNFKPEADEAWQNLAKAYTEETGTEVTVVTAASGQYRQHFSLVFLPFSGKQFFWKDYCYDLKDSEIYSQLTSDAYALKDGESVPGIAYVIESYGLIVNKTLLEKAGYTLDDIKSYDQLKAVADDIQSKKDELGIKGAFTSAGMDASSDWRFKTHLANLPIYYEYKDQLNLKGLPFTRICSTFTLQIPPVILQSFLVRNAANVFYRMVPGVSSFSDDLYSDLLWRG